MPVIDDRGRLFGKVNLVDALVAVFLFLLIPFAYATALLFRESVPTVTSVTPSQVLAHSMVTLRIDGANFRPFLRARIGSVESPLLVESASRAEVKVSELEAGTYDVALYDEARELARVPNAVVAVDRPFAEPDSSSPTAARPHARSSVFRAQPVTSGVPRMDVQVVGAFVGIVGDATGRMRPGVMFYAPRTFRGEEQPIAEILALGRPASWMRRVRVSSTAFVSLQVMGMQKVPAVIRMNCAVSIEDDYCRMGTVPMMPTQIFSLGLVPPSATVPAGMQSEVTFIIDAVRAFDAEVILPGQ